MHTPHTHMNTGAERSRRRRRRGRRRRRVLPSSLERGGRMYRYKVGGMEGERKEIRELRPFLKEI